MIIGLIIGFVVGVATTFLFLVLNQNRIDRG